MSSAYRGRGAFSPVSPCPLGTTTTLICAASVVLHIVLLNSWPHGAGQSPLECDVQSEPAGGAPLAEVGTLNEVGRHKYAVVTYYRAATPKDEEKQRAQVIALMSSILMTDTDAELVVMVHESTTKAVRRDFEMLGLTVLETASAPVPARIVETISQENWKVALDKYQVLGMAGGFEKVVFLDSDIIVMGSLNEMFEMPSISMLPNRQYGTHYNSGVIVFTPDAALRDGFYGLLHWMAASPSFETEMTRYLHTTQGVLGKYLLEVAEVHDLCDNIRACPWHQVIWTAPCEGDFDMMRAFANTRIWHFTSLWMRPLDWIKNRKAVSTTYYCHIPIINHWKLAYWTGEDALYRAYEAAEEAERKAAEQQEAAERAAAEAAGDGAKATG